MTVAMCTKSMCQMHNETMNIYTHFLPALYILAQMVMLLLGAGPYAEFKTPQSFWVQFMGSFAILLCMTASSVYHTFKPLSKWHFYFFLKLDFMGIGIMIFGLTLSAVYIGFHNWIWQRDVILMVMGSLMVGNLAI